MLYKGTYLALGLALVANTTLANIDEIVTVATRAEADVAEVIGTVSCSCATSIIARCGG